jgi:hypothetical protein
MSFAIQAGGPLSWKGVPGIKSRLTEGSTEITTDLQEATRARLDS